MKLILVSITLLSSFSSFAQKQKIIGDLEVTGSIKTTSTTKSSKPCPVMGDLQMDNAIATAQNGDCAYSSTKKSPFFFDSTSMKWKQASGSGGMGGVNFITNYGFEDGTEGWSIYADTAATSPVDGTGGASSLNIDVSTAYFASGEKSLIITKPASNIQGQGFSYDFKITPAYISKLHTIEFPYKTSSSFVNGDMAVFLYDKTNSVFVKLDKSAIELNTTNGLFTASFTATTSLDYRLIVHQASTTTASYSIYLDNVKVSPFSDKFAMFNRDNQSEWQAFTPTGSWTTNTSYTGQWRRVGSEAEIMVSISLTGAPNSGALIVNLPSGMISSGFLNSAGNNQYSAVMSRSGSLYNFQVGYNSSTSVILLYQSAVSGLQTTVTETLPVAPNAGTIIAFTYRTPIQGWTATTPAILGQTDTFSTDSANLFFKSTACTSSEIGCFNTYSYAANTNTRTLCTTAPTQTTSHMNTNGIQIFTRAYNAPSTCASPAAFGLVIGKGMKGVSKDIYKATGKSNSGTLDYVQLASTQSRGMFYKEYSETSGVLMLDAGIDVTTATTDRAFNFSDITTSTNGYLVINASKSPVVMGQMLGMARYIVKTYSSGTDWYEVYNDGWVRQSGQIASFNQSSSVAVTFNVSMKDTNYIPSYNRKGNTSNSITNSDISGTTFLTTGMTVQGGLNGGSLGNVTTCAWTVEGYGDSTAVKALGAAPSY